MKSLSLAKAVFGAASLSLSMYKAEGTCTAVVVQVDSRTGAITDTQPALPGTNAEAIAAEVVPELDTSGTGASAELAELRNAAASAVAERDAATSESATIEAIAMQAVAFLSGGNGQFSIADLPRLAEARMQQLRDTQKAARAGGQARPQFSLA
ncbi:MAG: hypothetical protein AAGJ54_05795 [Planctomycetota bacterium]